MRDRLEAILMLQSVLIESLGVVKDPQFLIGGGLSEGLTSAYVEAASGMVCESAEVLEQVVKMNKPWNTRITGNINERSDKIKEEVIDTLFYATELMILMGVDSEELFRLFSKKNAIVHARILAAKYPTEQERVSAYEELKDDTFVGLIYNSFFKCAVESHDDESGSFLADPVKFIKEKFDDTATS